MSESIKYVGTAALQQLIAKIKAADATLQGAIDDIVDGTTTVLNATNAVNATNATYAANVGNSSNSYNYDQIHAIKTKADGLATSYAISKTGTGTGVSNSSFDSDSDVISINYAVNSKAYIKLTDGTTVDLNDIKIGDSVFITETNLPDRWLSEIDSSGSPVVYKFSKLETKLTGYVTGTLLGSDYIVLGNGGSSVKNSSKQITTTAPSNSSDDTTVPTSEAVWEAISALDTGVSSVQVAATSPVVSSNGSSQSGGSVSTTISLADGYGDTKNPYGSKTQNFVLAAPSTANGAPEFRALVYGDLPDISGYYLPKAGGGTISSSSSGATTATLTDAKLNFSNTADLDTAYVEITQGNIKRRATKGGTEVTLSYPTSTGTLALVADITSKINALDVSNISGFGAGKTLATLTETDGKIAATFQDISITKSQISDFSHSHGEISNAGAISTSVTIANGDAIIIADSSASGVLKKASISFDGTTTSQVLSKAGTWVDVMQDMVAITSTEVDTYWNAAS